jgi:hypothetical protein
MLLMLRKTQLDFIVKNCNIDRKTNFSQEQIVIKKYLIAKKVFGFYNQLDCTNNVHMFALLGWA